MKQKGLQTVIFMKLSYKVKTVFMRRLIGSSHPERILGSGVAALSYKEL